MAERRALNTIAESVFDPTRSPPLDDWMGWVRQLNP